MPALSSALKTAFIGSFFFLTLVPTALGQTLRDAEYKAASTRGTTHLYRLEHDQAVEFFYELQEEYPNHPGPPLARAVAIWLRELIQREDLDLERFISPGYFTRPSREEMPEADVEAFYEGIAKSQENAEKYLEAHPGDKEARYYLGSCQGALGVFAFTIERSYRKALKHGRETYRIQREIVDEDPDFIDAYMTLGSYEYVVGNLPWYIKWIATLAGYHGTEARGFEYVARAAREGYFVKDDARLLLMVMYVREDENEYALEVAQQLHRRYPENYMFHLNQAQILERMDEPARAAAMYAAVAERAENKVPNYQKLPLEKIRYPLGKRLLALGSEDQALDQFKVAADDPDTPERERALSNLRAGEILDTMGRRGEAVSYYHRVQQLQAFDGSHEIAEQYLQSPYNPE